MKKAPFSDSYAAINANDMGLSRREYLKGAGRRFVLLIAGAFPHVWGNRTPVVFTTYEAALEESEPGDRIITEREFLSSYCNA